MYSEANRRETFTSWPHVGYRWAQPDPMAQAGFYHQVKGFIVFSICLLGEWEKWGWGKCLFFFFLFINFCNNAKSIMKKKVNQLFLCFFF